MAINTVIVDDERPARDELAFLLKSFPEINVVVQGKERIGGCRAHQGARARSRVSRRADASGSTVRVIKKLVERKLRVPQIVFATAYDDYAIQAFEVNAVDYVLKPFDKARIAKAVQRAKKMVEAHTSPVERLETLVGQLGEHSAPRPKAAQPVASW